MWRNLLLFLFVGLALTVLDRAASAQDFKSLLNGDMTSRSFKLKDLDSSWRRLSVPTAPPPSSSGGGLFGSLLAMGRTDRVYYTRGQIVTLDGDTYLVAYRLQSPATDWAAFKKAVESQAAQPTELMQILASRPTPETPMELSLLKLSALGQLGDIQPFDPNQVMEAPSMEAGVPVLAAILFPVFAQARLKARNTASLSNLKQIGLAAAIYMQDNDEVLPPTKDAAKTKRLLLPYLKNEALFVYPGTGEPYRPNPFLSRKPLAKIADPQNIVLFYEASPAADKTRGVVFVDGSARRIHESDWPRMKSQSHIP